MSARENEENKCRLGQSFLEINEKRLIITLGRWDFSLRGWCVPEISNCCLKMNARQLRRKLRQYFIICVRGIRCQMLMHVAERNNFALFLQFANCLCLCGTRMKAIWFLWCFNWNAILKEAGHILRSFTDLFGALYNKFPATVTIAKSTDMGHLPETINYALHNVFETR